MARSRDYRDQITPFNAPEPTMPWDDASAQHADDSCRLDEGDYHAPVKGEDDYEPVQESNLGKRFKLPKSNPVVPDDTSVSDDDLAQTLSGFGDRLKQAGSKQPHKVFKNVAVFVIAVSLITSLVGAVFSIVGSVISDASSTASSIFDDSDDWDDEDSWGEDDYDYSFNYDDLNDEERAVVDTLNARLAELGSSNTEAVTRYNESINSFIATNLNLPADQLQIDPSSFARKNLDYTSFDITSAYAFSSSDLGSVYCDVETYDTSEFEYDFCQAAREYLSGQKVVDESGNTALTDEQRNALQKLYDQTAQDFDESEEHFISFDLHGADETWTVDEEDYQSQIDYIFDLN